MKIKKTYIPQQQVSFIWIKIMTVLHSTITQRPLLELADSQLNKLNLLRKLWLKPFRHRVRVWVPIESYPGMIVLHLEIILSKGIKMKFQKRKRKMDRKMQLLARPRKLFIGYSSD